MELYARQLRQGDVLVEQIATLPGHLEEIPREGGKVVLAHGEATGHSHAIADKGVKFFRHAESGERFLAVSKPHARGGGAAALLHEEHTSHVVSDGAHRVIRQMEYSPAALRNVLD